jgi:hypothetical protein
MFLIDYILSLRAKELTKRKHRNEEKLKKAATLLERTTRRRTGTFYF